MFKATMPGFTAEASLDGSNEWAITFALKHKLAELGWKLARIEDDTDRGFKRESNRLEWAYQTFKNQQVGQP